MLLFRRLWYGKYYVMGYKGTPRPEGLTVRQALDYDYGLIDAITEGMR